MKTAAQLQEELQRELLQPQQASQPQLDRPVPEPQQPVQRSSRDGTTLTDIPPQTTDDELAQLFARARESGYAGKRISVSALFTTADNQRYLAQAGQAQNPRSNAASVVGSQAQAPAQEMSDGSRMAQIMSTASPENDIRRDAAPQILPDVPRPPEPDAFQETGVTDLEGATGAFIRAAVPYIIGAGVTAVAPAAAPVVGGVLTASVVTDMIIGAVNAVAGTNFPSTRGKLNELLTEMGVAEPDSVIETLIYQVTDSMGSTDALLKLTNSIVQNLPKLGKLSFGGTVAKGMAADPGLQMAGSARAPIGDYVARETGKAIGMDERGQNIMGFLGGSGADMSASALQVPSDNTLRSMQQRMRTAGYTPEQIRTAIQVGNDAGVNVRTSDAFPAQTPWQHIQQGTINALGGAHLAGKINIARDNVARDLLTEFNLRPGMAGYLDDGTWKQIPPAVAEQFASTRNTALNQAANDIHQAISSVPKVDPTTGAPIYVQPTASLRIIDDYMDKLSRAGGINANVNAPTGVTATAADAAAPNPYASQLNFLKTWRAALQNNDVALFDFNRLNFGQANIPSEGYRGIPSGLDKHIIADVYQAIKSDLGDAIRNAPNGEELFKMWNRGNETTFNLLKQLNQDMISNLLKPVQGLDTVKVASGEIPIEQLTEEAMEVVEQLRAHPELLTRVLVDGDISQVQAVVPFLSTEGRRMAVTAMIYDDMVNSIPNTTDLNRVDFGRELHDSFTRRGLVATPEEAALIDGTDIFLNITKNNDPVAGTKTPGLTSSVNLPPGAAGAALKTIATGFGAAMGTVAGIMVAGRNISFMWESPHMRDLLLDLVEAGEFSPAARTIAGKIEQALPSGRRAPLVGMSGLRTGLREAQEPAYNVPDRPLLE